MILPSLFVAPTSSMGRGVFSSENIAAGTVVEQSPVIVMSTADRALLDQTILHDYIFEWGPDLNQCCMALGYIPLYNHSFNSNCEYEMDYDYNLIKVTTVRDIMAGEELFINYNGNWDDPTPLWFPVS
ncbi:SET domain-containing protein [Flavihumibacter sp. ZG627]|uniref:SET domain-containing protein n=1 Tax=Flavihumibacter sp. ZG627 TaxID=1463156 RepID=UPI00057F702C|nr:SET domain-containing protein [Flavihumibacter sp. ZG627]KIC89363.1 lysine methyltransferase [Flavihumibacter sp. ZG627]